MTEYPWYVKLAELMPSIKKPEKRLTLSEKLKWTGIVLILFFSMGAVSVWGISKEGVARLEFYEILFGSRMGSIITLGIGPIVMASIILQMLVGSKIIPWDMRIEEDKIKFSAAQKLLTIFFAFFEASAYVISGAVPAMSQSLIWIVILQIALGGILIMYMDELTNKWGIGSGVSLFIAAGVSKVIVQRILMPPIQTAIGTQEGILISFVKDIFAGQFSHALYVLLPLISTIVVFVVVLYTQGIRVEIPLAISFSFGRIPTRKWPLKFFYTSNIPVILTAALISNIRLFGRMLSDRGIYFLGRFDGNNPVSGLVYYLTPPRNPNLGIITVSSLLVAILIGYLFSKKVKKYVFRSSIISGILTFVLLSLVFWKFETYLPSSMFTWTELLRATTYILTMVVGSILFSIFWVNTTGMDAKSVAEQFKSSYLSIPGFRRDPRIIERVLERYISALTILGGAAVGFLAGFADLTSALGTGTGILLTVMIIIQFFEAIAAQHMEDMNPALRKFIGR